MSRLPPAPSAGGRQERLDLYRDRRRRAGSSHAPSFRDLVVQTLDHLPEPVRTHMDNVAIVVEEEVSAQQRARLGLRPHDALLGLYEGISRVRRGAGYNLVPPDRITLFERPILEVAGGSRTALLREIRATILHEVGHHMGLGDPEIKRLERSGRPQA